VHDDKHPPAVLADLVTERGNAGTRRRVAGVTVYLDAPILAGGIELVGATGTGSVFEWDTQIAHEALPRMDAALIAQAADMPASAAERELPGPPKRAEAPKVTRRVCKRDPASITGVIHRSRTAGAS